MDNNRNIPLDRVTSIENNGKKYTVINDNIVEDRGILSTKEILVEKYKEILADPKKKEMFDKLTSKEKLDYLAREIYKDKKTYKLKHGIDQANASDKVEEATKNIANNKIDDSYSNQELGIVQSNGTITTIEEKPNGELNIKDNDNYNNENTIINPEQPTQEQQPQTNNQGITEVVLGAEILGNIAENNMNDILNNNSSQTITNETYLNPDQTEIISKEAITDNNTLEENITQFNANTPQDLKSQALSSQQNQNDFQTNQRIENQQLAPPSFENHKVRRLQPNYMNRNRIAGYIGFPIILTIITLSTILGLIIGSIIALYK